jgi:hypothetical protein
MASAYRRLLEPRSFSSDENQPLFEAWDAGNFRVLEVDFCVLKTGTAGNLKLQHAAINVEESFIDIATISADLTASGHDYQEVTKFLRYVRWKVDGTVTGSPVAFIDIIAKE